MISKGFPHCESEQAVNIKFMRPGYHLCSSRNMLITKGMPVGQFFCPIGVHFFCFSRKERVKYYRKMNSVLILTKNK